MGAAKCQYCKKKLNTKEAFKVEKSGINKYWCNEECYQATQLTKHERVITVKCKICGAKLNTKNAFKVTKNGLNKYYCSEQEWQAEEDRKKKYKEDKDRVYDLICDMWGYEIQNTKFFDEWRYWNKLQPNKIIYKYLRENETYLQQICDRSYETEYHRIRYFSAILKNNLRDFKPKADEIPKPKVVVEETIYETPTYSHNRRRSLADLEDDV